MATKLTPKQVEDLAILVKVGSGELSADAAHSAHGMDLAILRAVAEAKFTPAIAIGLNYRPPVQTTTTTVNFSQPAIQKDGRVRSSAGVSHTAHQLLRALAARDVLLPMMRAEIAKPITTKVVKGKAYGGKTAEDVTQYYAGSMLLGYSQAHADSVIAELA